MRQEYIGNHDKLIDEEAVKVENEYNKNAINIGECEQRLIILTATQANLSNKLDEFNSQRAEFGIRVNAEYNKILDKLNEQTRILTQK